MNVSTTNIALIASAALCIVIAALSVREPSISSSSITDESNDLHEPTMDYSASNSQIILHNDEPGVDATDKKSETVFESVENYQSDVDIGKDDSFNALTANSSTDINDTGMGVPDQDKAAAYKLSKISSVSANSKAVELETSSKGSSSSIANTESVRQENTVVDVSPHNTISESQQIGDSQEESKLKCPTHLYMGGNSYALAMLKKMGCPEPGS